MKNILSYTDFLKEDASCSAGSAGSGDGGGGGSAYATNGMSGMGPISSPQPSSIPGDVAGSTKGSGDVSATLGSFSKNAPNTIERKKKKKKKIIK
jgi:hypothetical protein